MKKLLACLVVSTVLFTGCTFMNKSEGIIKVNDTVITQAEFDKQFDKSLDNSFLKSFGGSKNFLKSDENPMYSIFKEKIVNELIVKALLDEEIAKRGITATNEDVENELKTVIDKVGSKDELNKILKQRGVSNAQFTEDLKTQIKIRKLVNSLEKINITDKDAEKYYNTHKNEFVHPEQVRASHILIAANDIELMQQLKSKNPDITTAEMNTEIEKTVASQKAKAEKILAEVKANPDKFAKIAQKESDDKASGERGGEDKMEAGTIPLAKVKDEVKFYLETQKQIEILKNFTAGLMKNAKIEYIDSSFDPSKPIKVEQKKEESK